MGLNQCPVLAPSTSTNLTCTSGPDLCTCLSLFGARILTPVTFSNPLRPLAPCHNISLPRSLYLYCPPSTSFNRALSGSIFLPEIFFQLGFLLKDFINICQLRHNCLTRTQTLVSFLFNHQPSLLKLSPSSDPI